MALRIMSLSENDRDIVEWPTLALVIICYASFIGVTVFSNELGLFLSIISLSVIIALHSSLQHEVLHGHPFRNQYLSEALVFLPIGIFIPYLRFKDTHLLHHHDPNLTDPYDDPESNFLDPRVWQNAPNFLKSLYGFNNTLAGRMLIGPIISLAVLYKDDAIELLKGNKRILTSYALHSLGLLMVFYWLTSFSDINIGGYFLAAYSAVSILKIRTFLEHRAHDKACQRTVIIEDRGLLSILFLNNNFHSVHHAYPKMEWYKLPKFYHSKRAEFNKRNGEYYFSSYAEIFKNYLFRKKDPVPHPLMSSENKIPHKAN